MRDILGCALYGNKYLKKSVVTGITKIATAIIYSDFNFSSHDSILHSKYAQYFGCTENEVDELFDKAYIKDKTIKESVQEWYYGYQIDDFILYNPWSIINFFKNMKIESYWIHNESTVFSSDILVTGDGMQEQMRRMIINYKQGMRQTIELTINPEVVFIYAKNDDPMFIWTWLAYNGYLSLTHAYDNEDLTVSYQARIPNREVLGMYMS
eukprot:gene4067-8091_t